MNCYKLIIFDMDGTILDTLDDLTDALNHALARKGYPLRDRREVRRFLGNGIRRLVTLGVPEGTGEEDIQETVDIFMEYYKVHCADCTCPYPGIPGLLESLRREGRMTAVVSNKADVAVQELCRQYFPGLLDYAVGERPGVRRKPHPDTVIAALEELGVLAEEAVYVGDSEVDLETARNAGMDVIAVTWGFRDRYWLLECGAKVLAEDTEELKKKLM